MLSRFPYKSLIGELLDRMRSPRKMESEESSESMTVGDGCSTGERPGVGIADGCEIVLNDIVSVAGKKCYVYTSPLPQAPRYIRSVRHLSSGSGPSDSQ